MTLTEQELYSIVFNRHLSDNMLKDSQIHAAKTAWIDGYFSSQFLSDIADQEEFIDTYIKPIWAWGAFYNSYHYIATAITDKGIIQMLGEGMASILSSDKIANARSEVLNTVFQLLRRLDNYASQQKADEVEAFLNYDGLQQAIGLIGFFGKPRLDKTPY